MRSVKILSLVAIAGLALMASFGAGSASATALCSAEPEEVGGDLICKSGTKIESPVTLQGASVGQLTFNTAIGTWGCEKSWFQATVLPNGQGNMGELGFSGCQMSIILCKLKPAVITAVVTPAVNINYVSKTEQNLSIVSPMIQVSVPSCGLNCKYAESNTVTGALSNTGQSLAVTKQVITGPGGGLCPKTMEESVTYHLDRRTAGGELLPVYFAKE